MRKIAVVILVSLFSANLPAQGPFSQLADPTSEVRTVVWNPQVGQGSEYDMTTHNGTTMHVTFAVTSTEAVEDQTGYWLEIGVNTSELGQIYMQNLTTSVSGHLRTSKSIFQVSGAPPMNFPAGSGPARNRRNPDSKSDNSSDIRTGGKKVGVETITVPAGTFQCEHWLASDGSGDAWLSTNVVPYSVVKATDKDSGLMLLTKTTNNAKSHITGKPVPFDPAIFMSAARRK